MSHRNEVIKVSLSDATKSIADNLIAAIQSEADPRVSKGCLVRMATLEAALAAFRHVDEIDPRDAMQAIVDTTVMLGRAYAQVTRRDPEDVLGGIILGIVSRADADIAKFKPYDGPKKEAS